MFTEGQQGNPIGDFGAPPRPTGIRRAMQSLGLMSRIGIIGGVALIVFALIDPFVKPEYSPLRIIGNGIGIFGGVIIAAEQNATRDASVKTTEAQADAANRSEAKKAQQIIVAEHAQNMRDAVVAPQVLGSWLAQGMCVWGSFTGDRSKQQACGMVPAINDAITQQQGGAIDALGAARQWNGQPAQQAPVIASAGGQPLSRGEFAAIARLEHYLTAEAAAAARQNLPPGDNGLRLYLSRLRVAAGEGQYENEDGPLQPHVFKHP